MIQSALKAVPISKARSVSEVHVLGTKRLARAEGYSIPGFDSLAVEISRNGYRATGFGEGPNTSARDKALSEAVERSVLIEFVEAQGKTETSNGWSCHVSESLAIENATLELIERDVALTTWQSGGPFLELPQSLWPAPLHAWKNSLRIRPEFFDLKILLSATVNGACISALLFNEKNNFVAGHASALSVESAILSATAECLRAAHSAMRLEHFAEVAELHSNKSKTFEPGVHSVAYAYSVTLPKEVGVVPASEAEVQNQWRQHQRNFQNLDKRSLDVTLFHVNERVVARVRSDKFREIFWGKDPNGSCFQNNNPHFVG